MNDTALPRILGISVLFWISSPFRIQSEMEVKPAGISPVALQRIAPASGSSVPFLVGETFSYNVSWKIFDAGVATLTLAEKLRFQNQEVYKVTATAQSTGIVSTLFKVIDVFESYFEVKDLCSRQISKSIREGSRQHDTRLAFDPRTRLARLEDKNLTQPDLPVKSSESSIPLCVQDVLSAFYFIRTKTLKVGEQVSFPINDGGRTYEVGIEVQAAEEIKTPAGTFQTLRLEPKVFDGLFKKKGRMFVWLTNDNQKIPVQLRARINIGTITAALTKVVRPATLQAPRR